MLIICVCLYIALALELIDILYEVQESTFYNI